MQENSPGYKAGLEPFFDFIISIENTRLVGLAEDVNFISLSLYFFLVTTGRKGREEVFNFCFIVWKSFLCFCDTTCEHTKPEEKSNNHFQALE